MLKEYLKSELLYLVGTVLCGAIAILLLMFLVCTI